MITVDSAVVKIEQGFLRFIKRKSKDKLIQQGEELAKSVKDSLVYRGRVSLPGETPTVRSEKLRNMVIHYDEQKNTVLVYPKPHGSLLVPANLEFGTANIEPRPYLRPAFERNITRIIRGWRNAIK